MDSVKAALTDLADFLMMLFEESKAHSTITGYRSAINLVWRTVGQPGTDAFEVTQFLDSFKTRSMVKVP